MTPTQRTGHQYLEAREATTFRWTGTSTLGMGKWMGNICPAKIGSTSIPAVGCPAFVLVRASPEPWLRVTWQLLTSPAALVAAIGPRQQWLRRSRPPLCTGRSPMLETRRMRCQHQAAPQGNPWRLSSLRQVRGDGASTPATTAPCWRAGHG